MAPSYLEVGASGNPGAVQPIKLGHRKLCFTLNLSGADFGADID